MVWICWILFLIILGIFIYGAFRVSNYEDEILQNLYEQGYIDEYGRPLKCIFCGSEKLSHKNGIVECKDCGEMLVYGEEDIQ